jgi:galactokinase/mevalonate kinase-like predicted kinase
MPLERTALGGKFVNVGRMDVIYSKTLQLRPQIIDANQENISLLFRGGNKWAQEQQKKNIFTHQKKNDG